MKRMVQRIKNIIIKFIFIITRIKRICVYININLKIKFYIELVNPFDDTPSFITYCENFDGKYIGLWEEGRFLLKRNIAPETFNGNKVCSIGYCKKENKWYGWSHRSLYGFGINDCIESNNHLCSQSGWTKEYLKDHPEEDLSLPVGFRANNIEDCKKMAIAFADSIS